MWDITSVFAGKLPDGFRLKETEDCLYLYYKGERVAIFSVWGTRCGSRAEEIEKVAERYLKEKSKNN